MGEGEIRSCDRRHRTRDSVLTPTVSRKLTGLRSRMMALGREGSRSGAISMTATSRCSSISVAPSCAGGQIANVVRRGNSGNLYKDNTLSIMNKNRLRWKGRKGHWIGQKNLDKQFSVIKKVQINASMSMATLAGILKEKMGESPEENRYDRMTPHITASPSASA